MKKNSPDLILLEWFKEFLPQEELERVAKTMKKKPFRITKAYKELFESYTIEDASKILTITETLPQKNYNGLVSGLNIQYLSFCEHHFLPFFGTVDIIYEPGSIILGIGKLSRLVDYRTKKFNIQEFIAKELCEDIMQYGNAKGCFSRVTAKHSCLCYRGPKKYTSSNTVTYSTGTCMTQEKLNEIRLILSN
jgi:GTP cyclohydrolase I